MTDTPLQQPPPKRDGAGWSVFERLMHQHIEHTAVLERMTPEQRLVFGLYYLRQEVNSGGFDSYFRWVGTQLCWRWRQPG